MKFQVLDYLRALGVILVTYGHVIVYGPSSKPFLGPIADSIDLLPPETIYKAVFANFCNIGEVGVSIFFLVSGFLIMKSRLGKSASTFLIRRLQRIYPIAIVGVFCSYLALMVTNHYVIGTPLFPLFNTDDVISLFSNSLLLNSMFPSPMNNPVFQTSVIVPTYWFLAVIVKYYVLMCFIDSGRQERIVILALILLINSFSFALFHDSALFMTYPRLGQIFADFAFSGHHIIYILVGCSVYVNYQEIIKGKSLEIEKAWHYCLVPLWLIGMFVLSFYTLTRVTNFPLPSDMLKNYFFSFCLVLFCLFINRYIKKVPSGIELISNTSFSVYVLHYSFAACFLVVLMRFDLFKANIILLYGSVFFLTGICGWLLWKFVENPVGRLKI